MKLRSRKHHTGGVCRSLGGADDPYFVRYNGEYCGSAVYESRVFSSGIPRDDDDQVAMVTMLYKSFATDEDATEYFWRFWGLHTSTVISSRFFLDVRDRVGRVGEEYRALYYNPDLMMPHGRNGDYTAAHLQYLFREDRTIVMLTFSGFAGVDAKVINPTLAEDVAEAVAETIHHPFAATAGLRRAAVHVLEWGNALDARLESLWGLDEALKDKIHEALASATSSGTGSLAPAASSSSTMELMPEPQIVLPVLHALDGELLQQEAVLTNNSVHTGALDSARGGLHAKAYAAHVETVAQTAPNHSAPLQDLLGRPPEADANDAQSMLSSDEPVEQLFSASFVFGFEGGDTLGSSTLDYLGVEDAPAQCSRHSGLVMSLLGVADALPCPRRTSQTDVVDMAATIAIPLGLLAAIELLSSMGLATLPPTADRILSSPTRATPTTA